MKLTEKLYTVQYVGPALKNFVQVAEMLLPVYATVVVFSALSCTYHQREALEEYCDMVAVKFASPIAVQCANAKPVIT